MKPSHTDHPRRRPVAFRWKRSSVPEFAVVLFAMFSLLLSAGQYEPLDFVLAVEVHHRAEQLSLLIGAAGVDAERTPDAHVAPGLVDVAVQREDRLSLLDGLPHRCRSNGNDRAPPVLRAQVFGELRGVVETRAVRWAVEVVDRALGRGGSLLDHLPQPLAQSVLVFLPIGVPRGAVRPPGRDHLEFTELDDLPLRQPHPLGLADDLVHLELVVVSWRHEALDAVGEPLVGHAHPALDGPQHLRVEELVAEILVRFELCHLVRVGAERVVAASTDRVLELFDLFFALEVVAVLEERSAPASRALLDYRHERFARHVAAQDHNVGLVVLAGVQELPPAGLRSVDIGREKDACLGFTGEEPRDHFRVLLLLLRAGRTSACDHRSSPASSSRTTSVPSRYAPATPGCAR